MQETRRPLVRSTYNYFVKRRDGVMAYNARSGTFAHLTEDVAEWLQSTGPVPDSSETSSLLEMGLLHHGDELEQILTEYEAGHRGDSLGLTIAPTLACNRSCDYCYQNEYRTDTIMSVETQDATVRFVGEMVRAGRTSVNCTFYGGEPLLAKDVVLSLSRRLRTEIEAAGGTFDDIGIVTNGALLDVETARELVAVGCTSAQISIDSLLDDGKALRGVIDAEGRPSSILTNAVAAKEHLTIGLRVNVSHKNRADLPEILRILREHGLQAETYLARVDDFDGEAGFVTKPDGTRDKPSRKSLPLVRADQDVLPRPEFARIEYEAHLKRPGYLQKIVDRLTPKPHACGATAGSLFVVDPAGRISACWNSVGIAGETIGSVHGLPVEGVSALRSPFLDYTPLGYATCSTCKVLPLCVGGCSHSRVYLDAQKPPCEAIKYQIDACVNIVGSRLVVNAPAAEKSDASA